MKSVATTPLPYMLQNRCYFGIFENPVYVVISSHHRHKKGTFLTFEKSTFGTKRELFPPFLTKKAYLCPSYPCLSLLPGPCNPQHRCTWDCSQRCSCHRLQPCCIICVSFFAPGIENLSAMGIISSSAATITLTSIAPEPGAESMIT